MSEEKDGLDVETFVLWTRLREEGLAGRFAWPAVSGPGVAFSLNARLLQAMPLARPGASPRLPPMRPLSLSRTEAIRIVLEAESEIRSLGVGRLALFGSVLRDEAGPDSDVDVLVSFVPGEKSFERLLALSELLETRLKHPVEVVTTEAISPYLGPRILAEAEDVLRAA